MVGFVLPELILESIIRDGIQNVKNNNDIIDSVFAQLTRAYNTQKYGTNELARIKTMINKVEIPVVYTYSEVDAKSPCFSIMLGTDDEEKRRAHLNDHYEELVEQIADTEQLAALVRVADLVVTGYNAKSGKVDVDPDTDLSNIYKGLIYVDEASTEHDILGGISNETGNKFFFIGKNEDVAFGGETPGSIKSSLDYEVTEIKGVTDEVKLIIGCHSKDALTTKYLYILLKYFILSRKADLISRGFVTSTFNGSDFSRNQEYTGDKVFTRFATFTGKHDDTWRSDLVELIDNVIVEATPIE